MSLRGPRRNVGGRGSLKKIVSELCTVTAFKYLLLAAHILIMLKSA